MIACLCPVRNGAGDIPGFLESAAGFADAVIALDDGSTDESAALLESHPLVARVLRSPPRPSYAGWDDRANRQRLLDAAVEGGFEWAVFLDVDERIDPEDAAALRAFLRSDALPGCAYGFRMYRSWDDEGVAPDPKVVFRAFALQAGLELPRERLHFSPVPAAIPTRLWIATTVRVRHLDGPGRLGARRQKYLEADPASEWERGPDPLLADPGPLVEWVPRRPGMPALALGEPGELLDRSPRSRSVVCLVPVRNGAGDIPGFLESAAGFADAVIALDDGSTDASAALLESHPLVARVLRSPPRPSYAGWDDRANRQRLLDAAVEGGFEWAVFLDVDERIDPDDAAALRRFADEGADPTCAYGFRVFRMVDDERSYDRATLWVYRMFAPRPDQALAGGRLHLVPVPDSIPPDRWRKTTIRVKHLASLTTERRTARHAKYLEADPDNRWQSGYGDLLSPPVRVRRFARRPEGLPVLADPLGRGPGAEIDLARVGGDDDPVVSAIVISRDDERVIERSVRAVVEQSCQLPFEVIVVASGHDRTAAVVRERFPEVTVVELPEPALPGVARNAGLAVASGEYLSFPGSHVELAPGSLDARVRAHELGYAMVTGTILNGTRTRSGWASYFLDHSGSLPARPSGELRSAPAHCSYRRDALEQAGGFPEDMRAGEDTVVNESIARRGYRAYRESGARLIHRSLCRNPWRLIRHHFQRGRAFGRILSGGPGGRLPPGRRHLAPFVAGYPRRRLTATDRRVRDWGAELEPEWQRARPLAMVAILAAWLGMWVELALPRRRRGEAPDAGVARPKEDYVRVFSSTPTTWET